MSDESPNPAPTWQPPADSEQFGGDLDAAERRDLPDSAFAFPRQRKEPLSSASHVRTRSADSIRSLTSSATLTVLSPSKTSASPRPTSMST